MELKLFGPVHAKTAFVSGEVAAKVTALITQVRVPPLAPAPGAPLLAATEDAAVEVHPDTESVTTRLYAPATFTTGLCWVELYPLGPVQANPGFAALVVVVKVTVGAIQVKAPLAVDNTGAAVPVTEVAEVLVQPFVVLVTFKV